MKFVLLLQPRCGCYKYIFHIGGVKTSIKHVQNERSCFMLEHEGLPLKFVLEPSEVPKGVFRIQK